MNQKLNTPGLRLQWIIGEIGITPFQLSKDLGYKSPDTIYHIINGINSLSDSFMFKIENSKYRVNSHWILTGVGEPFKYFSLIRGYSQELSIKEKIIYPARLDFYWIKRIAKRFANIIFGETEVSYIVEVRVCAVEGIEFLFTEFNVEKGEKYLNKYYTIILSPDWIVSIFYDFWRVEEESRRGQNLLVLSEKSSSRFVDQFENSLNKILNDLDHSDIDEPFLSFNKDNRFAELYRTDSR